MSKIINYFDTRSLIDSNHYFAKYYRQRLKSKDWAKVVLAEEDHIIYQGRVCSFTVKKLGFGVVEISKKLEVIGS
jgi:hypothetical protein